MSISLTLNNLASRSIRKAAVGNSGVRRIAINATNSTNREEGGLLSIYDGINKFGRSLMSFAFNSLKSVFTFSWTALWGQIVSTTRFLLNFNWNITDEEINQQIKSAEIALAAAKGSLAGQSLGFAVCGLIPTATIAVFNEPLALYMLKELGEEAAEEIAGSLASLVRLQIQQTVRMAFFSLFKNYRTLFRSAAIGFANILVQAGVLSQESVDKANKERNKPWSIAGALEETIESIEDPIQQAYAEEFWDEFGEACIEAGFIVASSADSYFAMQKMANESLLGDERIIEIQPIRDPSEDT